LADLKLSSDIDAFFDSVDRNLLMGKTRKYIHDADIVRLIDSWIKAEVWDGNNLEVIDKGIPQGSPLSPILAGDKEHRTKGGAI